MGNLVLLGMAISEKTKQRANGRWVPNEQVHPMTNVAGRKYRTNTGRIGVAYYNILNSEEYVTHWWFEPDYSVYSEVPLVPKLPMRIRLAMRREP